MGRTLRPRRGGREAGAQPSWKLPLPGERWHEEKMPVKDLTHGVAWPEEDAHLLLFVKPTAPGIRMNVQYVANAMLSGAHSGERTLTELERRPFRTRRGQGLAVRCTTSNTGQETDGWYVTVVTDEALAYVIALAPAGRPDEAGEALLSVASGLELWRLVGRGLGGPIAPGRATTRLP
jgi:hypothetical protein